MIRLHRASFRSRRSRLLPRQPTSAQYFELVWTLLGSLGVPPPKPESYEAPLPGSQAMASMTA